jgi:hypothetical protein
MAWVRWLIGAVLAVTGFGAAAPAVAMRFDIVGDTLILSGPVVDADLPQFRDAMQNTGLRQVLLHQSPGGDAWTGQRLGHEIRQAKLNTLISGRCASACGYMFLGGVERRLSDGMPVRENRLMLHGAWDPATGKTRPDLAPALALHIQRMTGDRYPRELVDATVNSAHPQDFMEFAITPRMLRTPVPRGVFQCLIGVDQQRLCKELEGYSAINTGVVTHAEIVVLDASVRSKLAALPTAP